MPFYDFSIDDSWVNLQGDFERNIQIIPCRFISHEAQVGCMMQLRRCVLSCDICTVWVYIEMECTESVITDRSFALLNWLTYVLVNWVRYISSRLVSPFIMLHVINVTFNCASSEGKDKSFPFLSISCSAVYLVDRHCKLLAEVAVIFLTEFIKAFCQFVLLCSFFV